MFMSRYLIIARPSGLHHYKRRVSIILLSTLTRFIVDTPDDTTNIQTIFDLYPSFLKHHARYHSHSVPFAGCKC
jgi:hypothetical protein